ncbi:MAG TPA: hypothetical protein VFZ69_05230 [Longimicrobiales bacterium]
MKRNRSLLLALTMSVLAPLPLLAQSGPPPGGRGGAMTARLLLEQGSVEYLVAKAADLQLTAEQTAQLQAIGSKWAEATKQSREQIRAEMPQRGQGGDREAMMQRMQELRPRMEKLREEDQKALDEALGLLGAEQQTKAKALLEERAQNARPRRG